MDVERSNVPSNASCKNALARPLDVRPTAARWPLRGIETTFRSSGELMVCASTRKEPPVEEVRFEMSVRVPSI